MIVLFTCAKIYNPALLRMRIPARDTRPLPTMIFMFFFLIIGHPPRSTLFPSTTLFRSGYRPPLLAPRGPAAVEHPRLGAVETESPDRKSTRLNSSHLVISYAVFCLT